MKVAELALASQPKAVPLASFSLPTQTCKASPGEQNPQSVKQDESFVRLYQKVHLYQGAMERFHHSLVYHNHCYCESLKEADLVDLTDQADEVELNMVQKHKL